MNHNSLYEITSDDFPSLIIDCFGFRQVNGVDLTQATHYQAKRAFNQIVPLIKMTVYRDSTARNNPIEKEDIIKITLIKEPGRQLGIKLAGKR